MLKNHYGILVDTEKPTTGVWSNNEIEFLGDEFSEGIDLAFEAHCEECKNEDHDHCYYGDGSSDYLIGSWKKNEAGLWEEDKTGEYAAIARETETQVTWSRWVCSGRFCSPCFPGQGEPSGPGEALIYAPPPDLLGSSHPRIKEIRKVE